MTRLVRPALLGLLWLVFNATAFSTPLLIDPASLNNDARFDAFSLSQLNNPEQALEELCRDSGYFRVLPDPTDSDADSDLILDFGDISSALIELDVSQVIQPRKVMAGPTFACYYEA
jgi:hypothetical protein